MAACSRVLLTLILLFLGAVQAWAGCEEPTTSADVDAALAVAERAFADLDVDGFVQATDEAFAVLPCVADPLPRHLIARWHRFMALRGAVDRDEQAIARSFRAARAIEPDWRFPESLVPVGNPLVARYEAADPMLDPNVEVVPPREGALRFDGVAGTQRPATRPVVLQHGADDGAILGTWYLDVATPMPDYQPAPPPPVLSAKARRGFGVGAITAGTAAMLLYGGAMGARRAHQDPDAQPALSELDRQRQQANRLTVAAAGAGAVSLGLGLTVALGGRRR